MLTNGSSIEESPQDNYCKEVYLSSKTERPHVLIRGKLSPFKTAQFLPNCAVPQGQSLAEKFKLGFRNKAPHCPLIFFLSMSRDMKCSDLKYTMIMKGPWYPTTLMYCTVASFSSMHGGSTLRRVEVVGKQQLCRAEIVGSETCACLPY